MKSRPLSIRFAVAAAITLLSIHSGFGEVKLAPVFSDGVVIQRGKKAPVWGEAPAGALVEISLGTQRKSGKADAAGHWQIDLGPMTAGGPFTLEAKSGNSSATIKEVLIGDVWLCSGQSNMQFGVQESVGGPTVIAQAGRQTKIHLLEVPKGAAPKPQSSLNAKWQPASPASVEKFSAVGYYFALRLRQDPTLAKVPIGLIDASFGGTAVEAWTPAEGMAGVTSEQTSGSMFGIGASTLYNGMINPLVPLG
jgi:sialate O-acetylesterase